MYKGLLRSQLLRIYMGETPAAPVSAGVRSEVNTTTL